MQIELDRATAQRIKTQLLSSPVAPGACSHFINSGTGKVLNILEEEYFDSNLADGISGFKYLEGDYGSGKTQFIQSLAECAHRKQIVTAIVNIGQECPFNSPLSIYKNIIMSFLPPDPLNEGKGIQILIRDWIQRKLREYGIEEGQEVASMVKTQVEKAFKPWIAAPDVQTASALAAIGKRLLDSECGADWSVTDFDLISWIRGDNVRSKALREKGIHEPVRDETAFRRLKTVIGFLRSRMGYRGFFVAFDEGTRTASFRRGSVKQKQAIENMLTMINDNAEGEFGGVLFLYAATPDFRSEVISKYRALSDRIGGQPFLPGQPITPLIILEELNSDEVIKGIGEKLLDVFGKAGGVSWDDEMQKSNIDRIIQAQKDVEYFDKVPPRIFVYHYCRFLELQEENQRLITQPDAEQFVRSHQLPESDAESE